MTRRFLALDGLRGVCALSVVFFHSVDVFRKGSIFQHGYLAVDVFFILSGFVISLTYQERLQSGEGSRAFLFNRARRLFPTYWIGASFNLIALICVTGSGYFALGDAPWMIWIFIPVTTFLLIPDYVTTDGMLYPGSHSIAWSLFTEWMAYFAYAFGAFRWKTSALIVLALAGWAAMAVAGYYTGTSWCTGAERSTLFTTGLLRCLSGFMGGMAIYRAHKQSWFRRLPVISTEVLLVAWLAIAMIPSPGPTPSLDAFLVIICSPILVCLAIRSDAGAPAYCGKLGDLSYPLYVAHPGVLLLAANLPVFGLSHGPNPLIGVLVLGISIGLAWAIMWAVTSLRGRPLPAATWHAGPTGDRHPLAEMLQNKASKNLRPPDGANAEIGPHAGPAIS